MLGLNEKVSDSILSLSQTMPLSDQVEENHVSSGVSNYIDNPRSLGDEILSVSDMQVGNVHIVLSDASSIKIKGQVKDTFEELGLLNVPPVLQLKGTSFPDHHRMAEESVLLSGSTSLSVKVLDLLFDIKPFGNWSSIISDVEQFVPNNKIENVLLLGMMKRSIILFGTKEVPLSKSRYTDVDALSTIASEFVLCLLKFNQCELLLKLLESIVISSNYNSNTLLQYALLLDKMGHHKIALEYLILIADGADSSYIYFIIIHTFFVHLSDFDSGIEWCHKVLKVKQVQSNAGIKSTCYLCLGIGYYWKHMKMKNVHIKEDDLLTNKQNSLLSIIKGRDVYLLGTTSSDRCHLKDVCDSSISKIRNEADENASKSNFSRFMNMNTNITESPPKEAMSYLMKAAEYDCQSPVIYFYLSLICAQEGEIEQAMTHIKHSLLLNAEYLPSLHLLVLLESSHNLLSAQSILKSILMEYPDYVQLYITQAHISFSQGNYTQALNEMREALIVWEKLYGVKECESHYLSDDDSGQFSVDCRDRNNRNGTCMSETYMAHSNNDAEDKSQTSSHSQLISDTKHVTSDFQVQNNKELLHRKSLHAWAESFFQADLIEGSRVDNFYNFVNRTLHSATICYDKLPSKRCILLEILGMSARIYHALNLEEDFVQCLSELLNICDVTISCLMERNAVECLSSAVLSHHCTDIMLYLGLYYEQKRDLTKARDCFNDVLSISHSHVEALYHRACIEKDLRLPNKALLTAQQSLQMNNVGIFKAKFYYLMGEIYDALKETDNASAAYQMVLTLNDTIPVCSYDIIPFVWK